jgi:hypothetical protein
VVNLSPPAHERGENHNSINTQPKLAVELVNPSSHIALWDGILDPGLLREVVGWERGELSPGQDDHPTYNNSIKSQLNLANQGVNSRWSTHALSDGTTPAGL